MAPELKPEDILPAASLLLRQLAWAGVPVAIIIMVTKALIARFPAVEAVWLFLAVAVPVIAITYAFAFWWRSRRA
jgi:hypothetical protein